MKFNRAEIREGVSDSPLQVAYIADEASQELLHTFNARFYNLAKNTQQKILNASPHDLSKMKETYAEELKKQAKAIIKGWVGQGYIPENFKAGRKKTEPNAIATVIENMQTQTSHQVQETQNHMKELEYQRQKQELEAQKLQDQLNKQKALTEKLAQKKLPLEMIGIKGRQARQLKIVNNAMAEIKVDPLSDATTQELSQGLTKVIKLAARSIYKTKNSKSKKLVRWMLRQKKTIKYKPEELEQILKVIDSYKREEQRGKSVVRDARAQVIQNHTNDLVRAYKVAMARELTQQSNLYTVQNNNDTSQLPNAA